jgi:hypothetical protein
MAPGRAHEVARRAILRRFGKLAGERAEDRFLPFLAAARFGVKRDRRCLDQTSRSPTPTSPEALNSKWRQTLVPRRR